MSAHPTRRQSREEPGSAPANPAEPTRDEPAGEASGAGDGRIGVSGTQVAASVLASVSAAVVASFFGVAGTIVGTAVVSVVATVGSAAYGLGIRRTKQRLQTLQAMKQVQARRTARPLSRGDRVDTGVVAGPSALAEPGESGWRAWLSQRRWGLAAGVALVFVISMAAVTLVELVGDGPLSGEAGGARGTSLGVLLPGDERDDDDGDDRPVTATTDPNAGSPTTTVPDEADEADPQTTTTAPERAATTTTVPDTATTTAPTTTTTASDAPPTTAPVPTTPPTTEAASAGG
jgi:hypothetical protein